MAGILRAVNPTGLDYFVNIISAANGDFVNGTSLEAYNAGNEASYRLDLTEVGSKGVYTRAFPAVAAGAYIVVIYQDGVADPQGSYVYQWDGSSEVPLATVLAAIDTEVASILAAVDTEVAAIKAKTDNLPASPAATGDAMTLTSGAVDAILDDAVTAPTAAPTAPYTVRSILAWLLAITKFKRTQTSATETVFQDDGSTSLATSAKTDDDVTFTRGEYS